MKIRSTAPAASMCMTILLLGACTEGGDGSTPGLPADFNSEVYGHMLWADLSPTLERSNLPTGNSELGVPERTDGVEYSCDYTEYSLTDSPAEFIAIQPDSSIMWLGNLIQGDSHLKLGSLQELSIDDRAPINISLDILDNDNARMVVNPSAATVNSAIGSLIASAKAAGVEGPRDSYYEKKEAHSTYQTSLEMGFSAEYLGASAHSSLEVDKKGSEKSVFAYFIQKAFTFSIELPTSPQHMVSDQFTVDKLDDLKFRGQISEDNPPLYISSVTYGKVLIYKMTANYSSERLAAAVEGSYHGIAGGGSGYSEAELRTTLSEAKIEISAFGGNQESIEGLVRSGTLADYFTGNTNLDEFRPIAFELRNLSDNTIAGISRTTEYDVKECTKNLGEPIGELTEITLLSVKIPGDCDPGINQGDIYGYLNVIAYNPSTDSSDFHRIRTIGRDSPEYVQSGNSLSIAKTRTVNPLTVNQYYGKQFQLSGRLYDADYSDPDDLIGVWHGNRNSISGKEPDAYNATGADNCSDYQPILHYSLKRLQYLY